MIVLFVTWHKTYTTYRAQKGVLKGPSITRVLLYNGVYACLDLATLCQTDSLGIGFREHILHVSLSSPLCLSEFTTTHTEILQSW